MWAIALLVALLAVIPLSSVEWRVDVAKTDATRGQSAQTTATNWVIYRDAAVQFAEGNKTYVGTIADTQLTFPNGYVKGGAWSAAMTAGGNLAVYGVTQNTDAVATQAAATLGNSYAVGINQGGQWVSPLYGTLGATVPPFVPNGAIVTLIKVN